jgi:hypothetical protein
MKYGYARVSTDGQSVDAQVRQLTKAGCEGLPRSGERREDRPDAASSARRPNETASDFPETVLVDVFPKMRSAHVGNELVHCGGAGFGQVSVLE